MLLLFSESSWFSLLLLLVSLLRRRCCCIVVMGVALSCRCCFPCCCHWCRSSFCRSRCHYSLFPMERHRQTFKVRAVTVDLLCVRHHNFSIQANNIIQNLCSCGRIKRLHIDRIYFPCNSDDEKVELTWNHSQRKRFLGYILETQSDFIKQRRSQNRAFVEARRKQQNCLESGRDYTRQKFLPQ